MRADAADAVVGPSGVDSPGAGAHRVRPLDDLSSVRRADARGARALPVPRLRVA
jgi:hypothetical protein